MRLPAEASGGSDPAAAPPSVPSVAAAAQPPPATVPTRAPPRLTAGRVVLALAALALALLLYLLLGPLVAIVLAVLIWRDWLGVRRRLVSLVPFLGQTTGGRLGAATLIVLVLVWWFLISAVAGSAPPSPTITPVAVAAGAVPATTVPATATPAAPVSPATTTPLPPTSTPALPTSTPPPPTATPPPATATPQPTPSPSPPTATSVPIRATPRPTRLAESPEVQAYVAFMEPRFVRVQQSLTQVGNLSTRMSNDPALFLDQSWRLQMGIALGLLRGTAEEIQKFEPVPPPLKALDDIIVSMGKDLVYVVDELAAGLDNLDQRRIANASQRMQTVNVKIQQATREMEALAAR